MHIIVTVLHVLIALALIGVVLLQKSDGGLGSIGGGGGMSGFMSGRSTANLLTRTTAILFASFVATSVALAVLAAREHGATSSIFDRLSASSPLSGPVPGPSTGKTGPAPVTPPAPVKPAAPSVPLAK